MAFEAYDDYEQSERVQQWLRQNGVSIAVGVVLGLLLIFGWQQWKAHRASHREQAAAQYQALQQAHAANKASLADSLTDGLMKDYDDTAYAAFAASLRAQQELQAGHADKAEADLNWAHAHTADGALKSLIALRLARVQLAAHKAGAALATLKTVPAADYRGMVEELRGDALVQQGHQSQARSAYQAALAVLDESAPQRNILQVKIDNLAAAPVIPNTKPATTGKQGA